MFVSINVAFDRVQHGGEMRQRTVRGVEIAQNRIMSELMVALYPLQGLSTLSPFRSALLDLDKGNAA